MPAGIPSSYAVGRTALQLVALRGRQRDVGALSEWLGDEGEA